MPLPPAAELGLSDAERKQLIALGRHRRCPRGIVLRIHIVLGATEGLANRVLARKLSTSVPTVLLWRKRFESDGIAGILEDRPRSGRPKRISAEREAAIVEATMKTTPKDATQWSVRAMTAAQKVRHLLRDFELAAVAQIFRDPGRAERVAADLRLDAGVGRALGRLEFLSLVYPPSGEGSDGSSSA